MEDLFYRKEQVGGRVNRSVRRLLKNKRLTFRLGLSIVVAGYVLLGSHGVLQRVRLHYQKIELEEKIRQAEADTRRLQAQSKALDGDKKAIEKFAREKYGMIREGETVYKANKK